jgi:PAS domain S-box-containing protein
VAERHAFELGALTKRVADAAVAVQRAEEQLALDRQAAVQAAATRQAAFDTELAQLTAARGELQSQLADATAALQRAEEQGSIDRQAAIDSAAEQKAAFDAERAQSAAKLEALRAQLADQATARQQAEQLAAMDRRALVQAAATQKTAFETELGQLTASRDEFARQVEVLRAHVTEADGKLQRATERHTSELASADTRLAETQQKADAALAAQRLQLADATTALERAELQAVADRQAAIDAAAAQRAAFATERAQATAKHEALSQQIAHAAVQATDRQARFDARLAEEASGRQAIERELVQVREESERAQQGFLDGVTEIREKAKEHVRQLEERAAAERVGWETTLADRQTRIGQVEREIDAARQSLAAKDFEIRRLQTAHETLRANFDRARAAADSEAAGLRRESAALQQQLDDHVRRFDVAPVSLCRVAADGTLTHASRRLVTLLGYVSAEDLQRVSLATTVFRSADELHWLIDRSRSSRAAQSIETTWAKKDGSRIIVRLVASTASDGGIDLAADDITSVKALEEKLNHAQRLEAVARYASEVAVTCENLLEDVKRNAAEWLPNLDRDSIRHQGAQLVADVSRASGLLRQVTLYGAKQKQVAPLVAVNNVLQDLASVLKRVAGDNIALVLPKDSKPLNLDVDAERAERIFVNVAAYARQRMPFGGRLLIESTPAIVDREFAEKYRNVRPGAHVLFTVTEQKSPSSTQSAPGSAGAQPQDGPGLDLGVLQSLVGDCGGHLWMAAEPSGDMVLKIHLPRRPLDDPEVAKIRGRWISRLVAATASRQLN